MMDELLASFPEELLIAFGMTDMNFTSILGMFGLVFLFCQICLAIQASNYGISLVSIEEREFTADFLLAKPVSRTKIMTTKLLAAISALTVTNLSVWASSFLVINYLNDGPPIDNKTAGHALGDHRGIPAVFPCSRYPDLITDEKGPFSHTAVHGPGVWYVCC